MIEVSDLTKYYGDREVLHSLNFSVATNKICGFLGPNGSGKSTTMDIIAGLLGPSSGSVRVCNYDVLTQSKEVKAHVGYLPDNPPLYPEMTVFDFVNYSAKLRKINASARELAVKNILEECDVVQVSNRLIGHLSKGFRQRVALSASLVHKPSVLILDEPTEGLDPTQIVLIRQLIKKLAKERTVILSSHILSEVQATCDEVIIINHGRIATKLSLQDKSHRSGYVYSFACPIDQALSWFQEQSFVEQARIYPAKINSISVDFSNDFWSKSQESLDGLSKVTEQIVAKGFPLVGIEQKKDALEELFFDVIRSQPNAVL